MDFYKVYMKQERSGASVVETIERFGLYCVEIPFKPVSDVKEITSRKWYDEDGLDEYIPVGGLKLSEYDIDIKFGYKGDKFGANTAVNSLVSYLLEGYVSLYDTYTRIGRQHVRFVKLNDNAELVRDGDGDILIFSVTMKVCDPKTNITLSK